MDKKLGASRALAIVRLTASMVIFGTVGVFRRFIPLSSSLIAAARGLVGAAVLGLVMLLGKKHFARSAVKEILPLLILSGTAMGFNWILLFEAYNYTTVAAATLCYYMAPVVILLLSPAVLGERLSRKQLLCVPAALVGVVLVSGVLTESFSGVGELRGIALGLGAAVLYASVVLMNKRMKPLPAYDKTLIQLFSAGAVLLVYCLVRGELASLPVLTPFEWLMLGSVCLIHTGLAYMLYFGSMDALPAGVLALFSYIDPVVAVLLSALVLHEPMTVLTAVGAVLILGSAVIIES